ncbi:MAG: transglutaminase family protein [Pirellulales bacterium]
MREQAEQQLLELGTSALPALKEAAQADSAEVRFRARRIMAMVHRRLLDASFERFAQQPDDVLDVEYGMWLVARLLNPDCQREPLGLQLDELADRVRALLPPDKLPREADPNVVVAAVRQVLFVEEGFTGNTANFDFPGNSSLETVLETKRGLPILLSLVVVAVGQRLDLPLVGIPTAGQFKVKYDGLHAPRGFPQSDIVLHPFEDGRILSVEEIKKQSGGVDPAIYLKPAEPRATMVRILANLISHLAAHGQDAKAERAFAYRALLEAHAGRSRESLPFP